MKKTFLVAAMLAASLPAAAQQPAQSASEQAMASKLMEEINSNLQARTTIVQQQQRIQQLEADVKKAADEKSAVAPKKP